jgi:hypothetical protein
MTGGSVMKSDGGQGSATWTQKGVELENPSTPARLSAAQSLLGRVLSVGSSSSVSFGEKSLVFLARTL